MCDISVVIPFYNDADSCIQLVGSYISSFDQLELTHEFIIVDDCSEVASYLLLKESLSKYLSVKIYRLIKNAGQYGALAYGISIAKGKKVIITDQDIAQLPIVDIKVLLEKSKEYDLQYIYQEDNQRNFLRQVFSSIWHLLIVLNIHKRASLKNPLPFRLLNRDLQLKIIKHNYTITALDIALLKYADHFSFYKIDHNTPLVIKTKSEYSISMLLKIGVYSVILILIELKLIFLLIILFAFFSLWITTHSLTLPIVIAALLLLVFGLAKLINNKQSYRTQIKQINEWIELLEN